jgi:hypothetical protein
MGNVTAIKIMAITISACNKIRGHTKLIVTTIVEIGVIKTIVNMIKNKVELFQDLEI